MAFTHRAFLFNSMEFHQRLEIRILSEGHIDLASLRDLASKISKKASGASLRALEGIRFDPSWLDLKDPDVWIGNELYVIALTESVAEAPSLSNRSPLSYQVIESLLPLLGWEIEDVARLIRGYSLDTLPTVSRNPIVEEMFGALSQFGGWLDCTSITTFRSRLASSRVMVPGNKDSLIPPLEKLAALFGQDPWTMIDDAFADATDMLNAAFDQGSDLWLILE